MVTSTISALTAILAGNLDDTAVLATDDKNANTRKVTVAQLRTQLIAPAITFPSAITVSGDLTVGASTFVVTAATGAMVGGSVTSKVGNLSTAYQATNTANGNNVVVQFATDAIGDGLINLFNLNQAQTVLLHSNGDSYLKGGPLWIGASDPGGTDKLRVNGAGFVNGALTVTGALQLGNAYVATPVTSSGYIIIKDSGGVDRKVMVGT